RSPSGPPRRLHDGRRLHWAMGMRHSFDLRRKHGLKQMEPGPAIACVDPRRHTYAREQRSTRIDLIKLEAYRQALDDLDPIAGRILGRQDRKIRSGARTH